MNWIALQEGSQLDEIQASSESILIFKHSTRCHISKMVLKRFESEWPANTAIKTYILDLIQYRQLSNQIAEQFQVYHESPQVLLIQNGTCYYDESHQSISVEEILQSAL